MSQKINVQISIDKASKEGAEHVLAARGYSLEDAIELLLSELADGHTPAFLQKLPNAKSLSAISDVAQGLVIRKKCNHDALRSLGL